MSYLILEGLPLPPSVNKLYFNKQGRRHLSAEGNVYKHRVKMGILEALVLKPEFMEDLNGPLDLSLEFYFKNLENKGWLQGKTTDRYKRIDVSNRVKVLEDAIAEALHIDDKLFFSITIAKFQHSIESVDITIGKRRPEEFLLGEV